MSSPQHPTGSGPQQWHDPHAQTPGANNQPQFGQGPAYGSGPAFGAGPESQMPGPGGYGGGAGSAGPGQYGSGAPGPYGSGPAAQQAGSAPYGSALGPGSYGSGPGQYGSAPGPYGSAPGPQGSGPGQFGSAGPAAPKSPRTGPGLLGPLTLRDLFLLFAGLLSLIVLFVPFKSDGFLTWSLWHWTIDAMGTLTFDVFGIWLIVAAVLVNKFGNGGLSVGSLSLDQAISVLSGAAFTFAFVHLLTSVQFWHVGAYLAFFAALLAFLAGVFTVIPFFGKEFTVRDEIAAHPKARPVAKRSLHPAPVANMPGNYNAAGGFGAPQGGHPNGPMGSQGQPGVAGYPGQFSQQQAPGQPGQPGGPGQFGGQNQPGGPDQFGQPGQQQGQSGYPGQQGQPGQFGTPNQPMPGSQFPAPGHDSNLGGSNQYGGPGRPDGQDQFGQPIGADQANPYAPPEQPAQEGSVESAPGANESAGQEVQSTGSGQTYLGAQHSQDPQHTQSEPTQTFGFGAHREESPWSSDGETAVQAPVPSEGSNANGSHETGASNTSDAASADELNSTESHSTSVNDDSSGAGTTAAVAGAGAVGVGAAVAGAVASSSDSERRRGRHAAPDSGTDSEQAGDTDNRASDETDHAVNADRNEYSGDVGRIDSANSAENTSAAKAESPRNDASVPDESSALVGEDSVSPAESSSLAAKVNARNSDTDVRASEGVALTPDDSATSADSNDVASSDGVAGSNDAVGSDDSADASDSTSAASANSVDSSNSERASERPSDYGARGNDSDALGTDARAADDEATVINAPAASDDAHSGSQRTTHPEADEPTQYVPMASYGNSAPETGDERGRGSDNAQDAPSAPQFGASPDAPGDSAQGSRIDEEETVVQSAVQPNADSNDRENRSSEAQNDAEQSASERGNGQGIIQAFWFAVPEPREAVDATTGMPVFTIYPGDWFLGLEDNGSWFKVRDSDGREGLLRNTEGVQRG